MGTHRAPNRKRQLVAAAVGLAVGLLVAYLVTRTGHHITLPHAPVQGVPWHSARLPRQLVRPHGRIINPAGVHHYTVRAGDCLWTIAQRHHADWRHIARVNHVRTPYLIYPGQVLNWR